MHKRLIMSCMAISAFMAYAVAPVASASPVMTEGGVPVAVGSSILAKNTGVVVFGGSFNATCEKAEMTGTLTANTGTVIKAEIPVGGAKFSGTGTSADCTSALGAIKVVVNSKLCEETKGDTTTLTGCGANVTFTLEITGTGPCKYSVASISATSVTNADATVNIEKVPVKKEEGGILCPSEGSLSVDFDQTTTAGETILIS